MKTQWLLGAILGIHLMLASSVSAAGTSNGPEILTEDVERFYRVYDAAAGRPTESDLQRSYIDAGSAGLQDFAKARGISGSSLVKAIAASPETFEGARRCVAVLPKVRTRLAAALTELQTLYPSAALPPVTITIGRNNSGGTTGPSGVLIGLEVICAADLEPDVEDRFVHMIAHEYAHVQQKQAQLAEPSDYTVLFASLVEGGAEFLGELISGGVAYPHLQEWTRGREAELERRFVAEGGKTDIKAWLYNGKGTAADPGDLGYWAGYRVTKAYHARAKDQAKALAEILAVSPQTAGKILAESGVGKR